jgi:hypothetical protein
MPAMTSPARRPVVMARGLTNEVASDDRKPPAQKVTEAEFCRRWDDTFSFCRPSRAPTSTTLTCGGNDQEPAPCENPSFPWEPSGCFYERLSVLHDVASGVQHARDSTCIVRPPHPIFIVLRTASVCRSKCVALTRVDLDERSRHRRERRALRHRSLHAVPPSLRSVAGAGKRIGCPWSKTRICVHACEGNKLRATGIQRQLRASKVGAYRCVFLWVRRAVDDERYNHLTALLGPSDVGDV